MGLNHLRLFSSAPNPNVKRKFKSYEFRGFAPQHPANNQIDLSPATPLQAAAISRLEETRSQIYAAGPALQLLTKYGLFNLRWYEEFGAHATPSGQQLMFSYALACDPGCLHGLFR